MHVSNMQETPTKFTLIIIKLKWIDYCKETA